MTATTENLGTEEVLIHPNGTDAQLFPFLTLSMHNNGINMRYSLFYQRIIQRTNI